MWSGRLVISEMNIINTAQIETSQGRSLRAAMLICRRFFFILLCTVVFGETAQSADIDAMTDLRVASLTMPQQLLMGSVKRNAFEKFIAAGDLVAQDVSQWDCVRDNKTGLIWEVKTNDSSFRDRDYLFSWYNSRLENAKGERDGGKCKGTSKCDTEAYIAAVNETGLCGYADWRLPTIDELRSIMVLEQKDQRELNQALVNSDYFPETLPSWYWSISENAKNSEYAWYLMFGNGNALNDLKSRPKHIRLVRNGQLLASHTK